MSRFPSPLTVAAVIGGYPHAPPQRPAMQRAGPAPGPVRPYGGYRSVHRGSESNTRLSTAAAKTGYRPWAESSSANRP